MNPAQRVEPRNGHVGSERGDLKNATRFTHEWDTYRGLGNEFKGGHRIVRHNDREYARPGGIYSNTAESFKELFERAVMGAAPRL